MDIGRLVRKIIPATVALALFSPANSHSKPIDITGVLKTKGAYTDIDLSGNVRTGYTLCFENLQGAVKVSRDLISEPIPGKTYTFSAETLPSWYLIDPCDGEGTYLAKSIREINQH